MKHRNTPILGVLFATLFAANSASAAWILISVDINKSGASATTQTGAAVLGAAGDTWNGINQNSSSGGLKDSTNVTTTITLSTITGLSSYIGGGNDVSGGSAMDAATTDLMRDYAFSDNAGAGSKLNFTLGGLAPSTNYWFVLYAAGDNSGQGASIKINGTSWGSTTGVNRKISSGNGVAYYYNSVTTNGSGQLMVEANALVGGYGNPSINGFQLSTVPEPGVALLSGIGALALLRRRRA